MRSLTIKFEPNYYAHTLAAESICTALVNTRGLLELCLHLLEEDVAFQAQIQALLRCVFSSRAGLRLKVSSRQRYFNLETFHCSGYFDLPAIVDSQSNSLQILATCDHWKNTLSAFQDIARRYPSLKLFSYEQYNYTTSVFNILNIFPALYPNNTFLWDPISKSYNCHDSESDSLSRASVDRVCVYLNDMSNFRFICDLVEEMANLFPNVFTLELRLEKRPTDASASLESLNLLCIFNHSHLNSHTINEYLQSFLLSKISWSSVLTTGISSESIVEQKSPSKTECRWQNCGLILVQICKGLNFSMDLRWGKWTTTPSGIDGDGLDRVALCCAC